MRPAGWRYAVDSLVLTSGQFLSIASLAVVAVLSARELGPTGRGELTLVLTIVAFVQIVGAFGITQAAVLLVPKGEVTLSELLGLGGILVAVNAPLCGLAAYAAMHAVGEDLSVAASVVAGAHGALALTGLIVVGSLQAEGRFRTGAAINAVGSVATLLIAGMITAFNDARPVDYLFAMIAGNAIQGAGGWRVLRGAGRPRITAEAARRFLRTGLPSVGLNVGQTGAVRSDRYLVGAILDARATGLYSVAATAAEMIRVLPFSATMVLMQRVSARSVGASQIRRARAVGLVATSALCGATALVAPSFVRAIFGDAYMAGVPALRILLLAELVFSVYLFEATVVAGRGRIDRAALASLLGFVVVVILDIPMVRAHGIEGAAWASVVAYLVMALLSARQHRSLSREPITTPPIITS